MWPGCDEEGVQLRARGPAVLAGPHGHLRLEQEAEAEQLRPHRHPALARVEGRGTSINLPIFPQCISAQVFMMLTVKTIIRESKSIFLEFLGLHPSNIYGCCYS